MQPDRPRITVTDDDARWVRLGGVGFAARLSGADTGGAFSVVEFSIEPGRLAAPHTHWNEDEFSYVLEGEIAARVGDEEVKAAAGSFVCKPRGIPHTFWNPGTRPARILEIISPAGFEQYFQEFAAALAGGKDMLEQRAVLARKYNQPFNMDWVPELLARHGLKLVGQP